LPDELAPRLALLVVGLKLRRPALELRLPEPELREDDE